MKYKLAKKLKEAGFPQEGKGKMGLEAWRIGEGKIHKRTAYIPTLEEIIDACGDKFHVIDRVVDKEWRAYGVTTSPKLYFRGETPLEAVAKLYIKLKN